MNVIVSIFLNQLLLISTNQRQLFQKFKFQNLENHGNTDWIGDGFCDDINNKEVCNYDDGDCCGLSAKLNFCVDCTCKSKYLTIFFAMHAAALKVQVLGIYF